MPLNRILKEILTPNHDSRKKRLASKINPFLSGRAYVQHDYSSALPPTPVTERTCYISMGHLILAIKE